MTADGAMNPSLTLSDLISRTITLISVSSTVITISWPAMRDSTSIFAPLLEKVV